MDFTLPETGSDVAGLTRDIASAISTDDRVATLETSGAPIDDELWQALGSAGLLGLELGSTTVGDAGGDLTAIENLTVATELGRTLARVPFGPHAVAALPIIAGCGSAAVRENLLRDAASGAIVVSVAIEEDLGGADTTLVAAPGTADCHTLTGCKVNVPYAAAADALLVSVIGPEGPAVVVVDTDQPGVIITATPSTGLTPIAQIDFTDVPVDDDHILTGGGATVTALGDRMALAICADQRGVVERALELTAEYAREREQFGKPIGSFQAVAQRLADGYIDVQGLALTTTQATWLLARSDDADPSGADTDTTDSDRTDPGELDIAVATAKFWAAQAGHRVAHTAVHVHGGVGLDTSHPVHRYFLRAKQNEFSVGSAPITLRRIGAALAARPV